MSSKSPAVIQSTDYAIMSPEAQAFVSVMEENLGGDQLTVSDLPRVSVPTGETTMWSVPSPDGKPRMVEEICGVLIHHHRHRAFWHKGAQEGGLGTPPDCSSQDGIIGVVNPSSEAPDMGQGGSCINCPLAQFGSHKDGSRQACKDMRRLFIVQPDSMLPIIVNLPPTSIKAFKQFMTTLTGAFVPFYQVLIGLGLQIEKSSQGIKYPQMTIRQIERLGAEPLTVFGEYRKRILPFLKSIEVDAEDLG